jgi:TetR/AcrR family transcriptional regulator, transcriptional repressor for nem operon
MRKGEQTRHEIIRKAAPVFNQKGYEGAALSDLMEATSLEKGGIYRHFESKQNTVDRLKQLVRNFQHRRSRLVAGGCPLLNTAIDSDDGNAQLREKARKALNSWLDRIGAVVEEGQRRGEIRPDIDSSKLSALIVSTLEGSLMVSRLQRKEDACALTCEHLEEYLETSVRANKSRSKVNK